MTEALIGREHPSARLRAEVGRATESHGGLVLVTGEAGIGKTTLVAGAIEQARELGALVLSGTCWDSASAPGYWPWTQVVRALRRAATPEEWAGADSELLAALLGEQHHGGEDDGFKLYDAVTNALVSVAQRRPVVVVLDDLHWADTASLKLLEFAARHTWFERLLLIGTYRDAEVETAGHPLRELMLPLVAKATTVTLTGLAPDEVGALMTRTAGETPDASLVAEVHRRTGGNPFFVEQTARLWRSGSSATAIAPGVRDALQRRLSLLPEPVLRLLSGAAVLGREFHRQVLAATAAAPVPQVDRLLDQAVSARLVVVRGEGVFAFTHDLVRESLYAELADAAVRHAAVVRALDRSPALAVRVFPADLARHAYLAGAELERAEVVDLLVAAAVDANSRMAIDEAFGHYQRAFEVAEDPRTRIVVALDLGAHALRCRERDEATGIFDEAVRLVRKLDEPELLARVALTLTRHDVFGGQDPRTAGLLTEAHRRLCGGDPAELLSLGSMTQELTARVVMLARDDTDDGALEFGLWARHDAVWGPGGAAERVKLTDELAMVGRRTGNAELEQYAASFKWVALLEQGDPRYLDQLRTFVAMVGRDGVPTSVFASLIDRSIIHGLHGRFAEAAEFRERALSGEGEHDLVRYTYMVLHLRWAWLLLQGRFDELAELHRELAEVGHASASLLETITAAHREDGEAALRLSTLTADSWPRSPDYAPLRLTCEAQLAAITRDPAACERARTALLPYRGQWVVSLYGCDIGGPGELWLGLLDAAQERWDDAVEHFTAASRSADLLLARPWSVEARTHLAKALLARGDAAEPLLTEVAAEAAELGMRHIADRVRRIRSAGPAQPPECEFRRDDAVWSLRFDGLTVRLPDAKGLRDLHFLLGRPGTDVPAVRLLAPDGGDIVVAAKQLSGDAVLDDEAKAQYKRRLDQLDEQIDAAVSSGDDTRAAQLDRERDALLTELRSAAGLGGRTRRLGDEAERARKTVTARIRDSLRKIDELHPALATHLRVSVTTGMTCGYAPGGKVSWRL